MRSEGHAHECVFGKHPTPHLRQPRWLAASKGSDEPRRKEARRTADSRALLLPELCFLAALLKFCFGKRRSEPSLSVRSSWEALECDLGAGGRGRPGGLVA